MKKLFTIFTAVLFVGAFSSTIASGEFESCEPIKASDPGVNQQCFNVCNNLYHDKVSQDGCNLTLNQCHKFCANCVNTKCEGQSSGECFETHCTPQE